jgi:hypothetical protein
MPYPDPAVIAESALQARILSVPRFDQVQCSTEEQLQALRAVANILGLYDAADVIRNILEAKPRS